MHSSVVLLAVAVTAASAGRVFVDNLCPFPLFLNSYANNNPAGAPVITLPANTINAYNEVQRGPDPAITNNAIRISATSDAAQPLLFTYNQDTASRFVYYALSEQFGDPLRAQGFEVITNGGQPATRCPPRTSGDCPNTYSPSNPNGAGAVKAVPVGSDFTYRLCASDIL